MRARILFIESGCAIGLTGAAIGSEAVGAGKICGAVLAGAPGSVAGVEAARGTGVGVGIALCCGCVPVTVRGRVAEEDSGDCACALMSVAINRERSKGKRIGLLFIQGIGSSNF